MYNEEYSQFGAHLLSALGIDAVGQQVFKGEIHVSFDKPPTVILWCRGEFDGEQVDTIKRQYEVEPKRLK